ncbi:MAG TPA: hypothetical protein P5244_08560 [Syntrophales bacterium]|nr:hypothetical protein [Syntrophales bacterium]
MHRHPEGAQGILDQEFDHVGFGVKLGDGDDVSLFDLRAFDGANLLKDPVLFLGVPVLIGPAEGIRRREDFIVGGQQLDAFLQSRHAGRKRDDRFIGMKKKGKLLRPFEELGKDGSVEPVVFSGADLRVKSRQAMMLERPSAVIFLLNDDFVDQSPRLHAAQGDKPVGPGIGGFLKKLSDGLFT